VEKHTKSVARKYIIEKMQAPQIPYISLLKKLLRKTPALKSVLGAHGEHAGVVRNVC